MLYAVIMLSKTRNHKNSIECSKTSEKDTTIYEN